MDGLVAVTPDDPEAGTGDKGGGGDMFAEDAKMAESHGGDAGGVTFPLIDGEQVLKAWHAPTSDSVFQLSRNNLCLVKTNKRVGYTAEKVQPCCPDKILFARQMQVSRRHPSLLRRPLTSTARSAHLPHAAQY